MTSEAAGEAVAEGAALPARTRLWDLPVRITHWSFVLLLPALWWTSETHDTATHKLLGYVLLGLLLFRLYWGVTGSTTARFASFVKGPRAMLAYLRGRSGAVLGHNPLGAWSVIALLLALVAQVTLGLFTQDVDGIEAGPLTYLISYDSADAARVWHGRIFYVLLALIAVHLAAIAFYLVVKRDNLVGPMVTGHKTVEQPAEPLHFAPAWRAILGIAISAGLAWWVSLGCPLP